MVRKCPREDRLVQPYECDECSCQEECRNNYWINTEGTQLKIVATPVKNLIPKIRELRELVWGLDIPSPTTPEYKEHHRGIVQILQFINEELLGGD